MIRTAACLFHTTFLGSGDKALLDSRSETFVRADFAWGTGSKLPYISSCPKCIQNRSCHPESQMTNKIDSAGAGCQLTMSPKKHGTVHTVGRWYIAEATLLFRNVTASSFCWIIKH